jgi:dTDP-4-dehydrorhamnose 3,5-epimerase
MKITETKLKGCFIIEPNVFGDYRGYFSETYNKKVFEDNGIFIDFIQDNQSLSKEMGTLRGIHFQKEPMAQAKLVRCTAGAVYDVAVDLREGSETFGQWFGIELTADNHKQLLIPRGFGHAFQTITNDVIFQYKVDNLYSKENERAIIYNDPDLNIDWPVKEAILSEKDKIAPTLKEVDLK